MAALPLLRDGGTGLRDFFWFQWDNLLLESTALALLLPASPAAPPHPWVVFLFRWLVFRLLFESGLAKVQQGAQSWFPLMAMAYCYETELLVLIAGAGVTATPALARVREAVQPFRVASKYHLFAHVDPRRVEAEIEWTADGQEWRPYRFHYKPGDLDRRPPVVAPHQPRVDFQLWFFTLGRDGGHHPYFNNLVSRLCTRPERVELLFRRESLPPQPPVAIRVAYYRYQMTDLASRDREGRYWSRGLVGYHPAAYFCDSGGPPRF